MDRQDFNIIPLPDGRKLSYSEYGDHEGMPVFFLHGFPDSRYDGEYIDRQCGEYARLNQPRPARKSHRSLLRSRVVPLVRL